MPDMSKPTIFIGSSSENLELAYALQTNLEPIATPTVWTQGIFGLSRSTLESLIAALNNYEFAVFIFAPNDLTKLRDSTVETVRDNVVFEFGLFIGRLGSSRCYFVVPRGSDDLHLPSDLLGITPATYDAARPDRNWQAALGPVGEQIKKAMSDALCVKTPREIPLVTATKLVGLSDIGDRTDDLRALPPDSTWRSATEEILISGPTLSGVVTGKSHALDSSLKKGRRVKLLLLHPQSADFARIASLAARAKLEAEASSTILKIVAMGWNSNPLFEARYLTHPMMYSTTLIDGGIDDALEVKATAILRVQPYLPTLTPHAGLVLQFSSGAERDIFTLYRNDIRAQWKDAIPIPTLSRQGDG